MSEKILGIPDRSKFSTIPTVNSEFYTNYVLHSHAAEKAGQHFDFRLNIQNTAYSWAMRYWPKTPKEKRLGVRQPDHTVKYMSFTGGIEDGYGKGKVAITDSGKCKVKYCSPREIHVILLSGQHPVDLYLKYTGDKNWLFINVTKTRDEKTPLGKDSYKDLTKRDITSYLKDKDYVAQPKIDGAHNILILEKGKSPSIVSHRKSKRSSTGLIEHTHRFKDLNLSSKTPKDLAGEYRGEVYALKDGKTLIPAEQLGGLLNSKIEKSLREQDLSNIHLRMALFGLDEEKNSKIRSLLGNTFEPVPTAKSEEEKVSLIDSVRSGKNKLTEEGVVFIHTPTGKFLKYRLRPDFDVFIRKFFEGQGKYSDSGVGGFWYSMTEEGPLVGKVGTGFTDSQREDMYKNPEKYIGRVATLHATRKTKTGSLFQPSFVRMHLDK